ncbi:PadR family transcriptional regulator [Streptomyces sp. NPDC092369]|uniref:PadR family transcriptional regulator n=1 Tax=Streptomyces sp. NPDC092369 TaxID=3366015 RepID=UPI003801C761
MNVDPGDPLPHALSAGEDEPATRLSATSYLVLGLIGLRGPSTPYDLKRAAGRSISYFWPFPHSQLYSEPKRLAASGLLAQQGEEGGRRRLLYSLTDSGRAALEHWLRTAPQEIFEMRDTAVMQLFFSEFLSTEELEALARQQIDLYRERLAVYADILRTRSEEGRERRMAPLRLGIALAETYVAFWQDIAENPPPGAR